jgi:glyceraldehyde-3-phosphate dehydrogenase (NADP+)
MSVPIFAVDPSDPKYQSKPFIDGAKTFIDGKVLPWTGERSGINSPIIDSSHGAGVVIGRIAHLTAKEAIDAVTAAKKAWNHGQGEWPQATIEDRIAVVERLVIKLKSMRDAIVNVLQWEICKTESDAAAEFDRTMIYIHETIHALREMSNEESMTIAGIQAKIRRAAIGMMLVLGPFNYPFNETYATLIPALLMGNTVVMKIPSVGGLAHVLTMDAFASTFPPGVVNFVSGPGRELMSPIMEEGVDLLAFIGGAKAADVIIKQHPAPHRLNLILSLEGKDLGIVTHNADIGIAAKEVIKGALTYNGQRCTALKMIFVNELVSASFIEKLRENLAHIKAGLPWTSGVSITPLAEPGKIDYMQELLADALQNGATIVNADIGGGMVYGNIFYPAIITPVTNAMRIWHEEQFGPIIPIAIYEDINQVFDYIAHTPYGLQASVFSSSTDTLAPIVDVLSTAVGRIDINAAGSRSPDVFPFTGRRSSALGELSVHESLRAVSIDTVIAYKTSDLNCKLIKEIPLTSKFLAPVSMGK